MLNLWVVAVAGLVLATSAMKHIKDAFDVEPPRECVALNLNGNVCPAPLTVNVDGTVNSYLVKDPFSHVIGDVTFGDHTVTGDCSYSSRVVHSEHTEAYQRVMKVRTVHNGVGTLLEEFVETEEDSGHYVPLVRKPIGLDVGAQTLPEHVFPLWSPDTSSTTMDIEPLYKNTLRIGEVKVANQFVPDHPCISRTVNVWERNDGRRVVSVDSVRNDEEVESVAFIETEVGSFLFEKYEPRKGMVDIYIGNIEDELDFELAPEET